MALLKEAKIIKKAMIDRDHTPASLAQIYGTTSRFINYILTGQRNSAACERIISEALGIPYERFIRLLARIQGARRNA